MTTKPLQAGAAKFGAQLQNELLGGHNEIEDALGPCRFTLQMLIRAVGGVRLTNDPSAIVLYGDIQCRLEGWLKRIDVCLPRQRKEMTLRDATPTLVEIIEQVPPMVEDLKRLERYLSPMAMFS